MTGERPGGAAMGDDTREREPLRDPADNGEGTPPGGQATSSGGGYGVGSERGSGGTGEGTRPAGEDSETDWLRQADGGPAHE